jgi:hypothetical protein
MAGGLVVFLIVVVVLFVAIGALPALLAGSGPLLIVALAILAVIFVPALRRMAIGVGVLAFGAYLALSAANAKYQEVRADMSSYSPASMWDGVTRQLTRDANGFLFRAGHAFIEGDNDGCCIHYNDVEQGENGNCFLLSALAALARVNPAAIKNAVGDNRDGTFTVTLHDDQNLAARTPIRVTPTFPANSLFTALSYGAPASPSTWYRPFTKAQPGDGSFFDSELWVMLIEKAYAQQYGGYEEFNDPRYKPHLSTGFVFSVMTGQTGSARLVAPRNEGLDISALATKVAEPIISTAAELKQFLSQTLPQHAVVVGTTPACGSSQTPPAGWLDAKGLPTADFRCTPKSDPYFRDAGGIMDRAHAYFVIAMTNQDGKDWVHLGNPWGGVVMLTLEQFLHAIRHIDISSVQQAGAGGCTCS